jgi:hypothetical protein
MQNCGITLSPELPIIVTGFCQPQLSFEKVRNLFDLFAIDQSMQRHSVKIVNVAQ